MKFFQFFQQPYLSILLMLSSMFFALLVEAARVLWGEKLILFSAKISLIHLLVVSIDAPLSGFLRVIMTWSVFKPTRLSRLTRYFLRHDIMHNFLSAYELYSNLSKGLPFLEFFHTSVGIKMIDRSFKTILDTLKNLTALLLWAQSSNNKIRSFCISSLSDNELLSSCCCSKYPNKIPTFHRNLNPVMYLLINGSFFMNCKEVYGQW